MLLMRATQTQNLAARAQRQFRRLRRREVLFPPFVHGDKPAFTECVGRAGWHDRCLASADIVLRELVTTRRLCRNSITALPVKVSRK
jgi:hypothetical protein